MDNKFDGFVGIFDNVLPENYCTDIIKYFEDLDKTGFIQSTKDFVPAMNEIWTKYSLLNRI